MAQSGLLAAADGVVDPGVRAVACFEELRAAAGGVGGQELVAPPVGFLEQRQLSAGVGFLAAAENTHVGWPVRQLVAVGVLPQQAGQLHHTCFLKVAGCSVGVQDGITGIARDTGDGGTFPAAQVPAEAVMHAVPAPVVQCGDVIDQAVRTAGTVDSDQ